jgi:hypothetical protein
VNKEQLAPWLEKLNAAEKKDRNAIVTALCKAEGISIGDAWKVLKEAGFDPKAGDGGKAAPQPEPTTPVQLRHKTQFPLYRCAGLLLRQTPVMYQVTEAQLETLRRDPWVVTGDGKEDGKSE